MRFARLSVLAALLSSVATSGVNAEDVAGRVVDQDQRPVAGVEVASFWMFNDGEVQAHAGAITDDEGRFSVVVSFYGSPKAVLALNEDRTAGGLVVIDPSAQSEEPVTITIAPLVSVEGSFYCEEFDQAPSWTNVYMSLMPGRLRVASSMSSDAVFSFKLPPGEYEFYGYGTDVQRTTRRMTLSADRPLVDMGRVNLEATIIARHYGKAPPDWNVTDARGVEKNVQLSDFKGKWVLLEFWGYW